VPFPAETVGKAAGIIARKAIEVTVIFFPVVT